MYFNNQKSSSSKHKLGAEADQASSSFVVLKTENDESVYLKTEAEPHAAVLNAEPPFTFNNTIHSERKEERDKSIEHKIKRMMLEKKLD